LVNCQLCVRAGGKHNDLDDVGMDSYHLTSFDMLGSWSINKYWKKDAIELCFNYLIKCGLDPNRMYATYFEGNNNIPEDLESKVIWEKYLSPSHIVKGSYSDNFWSLGKGPCGPCTEIHYDLNSDRTDSAELVNKDDPSVIEIWNIVLMQYNETVDENDVSTYVNLERTFIDAGMGLSRLAMVLQNKTSIFQTDLFSNLIKYVEIMSNNKQYTDNYSDCSFKDISFRIFADHMKTLVMTLYDGAIFDSHDRGFVLRKIIRRLLSGFYVYLNDCKVVSIFSHHIIPSMISYILNHHLYYTHDTASMINILINEELLFIGKINALKLQFNFKLKKFNNNVQETLNDMTENITKIKETKGVGVDIVNNIDKLYMSKKLKKTVNNFH